MKSRKKYCVKERARRSTNICRLKDTKRRKFRNQILAPNSIEELYLTPQQMIYWNAESWGVTIKKKGKKMDSKTSLPKIIAPIRDNLLRIEMRSNFPVKDRFENFWKKVLWLYPSQHLYSVSDSSSSQKVSVLGNVSPPSDLHFCS